MARYNAYNNWESNLGANSGGSISDSDTEIKVGGITGGIVDGEIPALPFKITVEDEIMNVTGAVYNGTGEYIFTVERGQEGTTAVSHSDGVVVENRLTAEVQNKMWDTIEQSMIIISDTEPDGIIEDRLWLDTTDNTFQGTIFSPHIAETTSADDVHSSKTYADTKVTKAGDTMTGDLNMQYNQLIHPNLTAYKEQSAIEIGSGTINLDMQQSNAYIVAIDADTPTTINVTNGADGHSFTLILIQHANGPAITFGFSPLWAYNTPPTIENGKTHVFTFFRIPYGVGSEWFGNFVGFDYGDGS